MRFFQIFEKKTCVKKSQNVIDGQEQVLFPISTKMNGRGPCTRTVSISKPSIKGYRTGRQKDKFY